MKKIITELKNESNESIEVVEFFEIDGVKTPIKSINGAGGGAQFADGVNVYDVNWDDKMQTLSNLTVIKEVIGSEVYGPTVWDFDIEELKKVRMITVTNKSNVTGSALVATFVFTNNDIDAQIEAGATITAYANISFATDGGYPRLATYTINFDLSVGYASFGYHESEQDMWFFKVDNKDVITFWG